MKDFEADIPSSATEAQPIESAEQSPSQGRERLKKIGSKAYDVVKIALSSGAFYGVVNQIDSSLPPQYGIPGSVIVGAGMVKGSDAFESYKKRRRAKKNAPENPDTPTTDASVV
jgi:hypothetical protein